MSENYVIPEGLTSEQTYEKVLPIADSLINPEEPVISALSNISSLLKEAFPKISWVGFYILKNSKLYLGPFQGKSACTQIKIGSGVCGTAVSEEKTQVVENVHEFPGHIACDSGSNSEIVVPIFTKNGVFGVLDIDSYNFSSFDETDKIYLEKLCKLLSQKLQLESFILS
jgi:GAF domain-containing protein